jgi:hypothetical protein
MRKLILVAIVLVLAVANVASAADVYNRGDGDYHNPDFPGNSWCNPWVWIRWAPASAPGVPTTVDRVLMNRGPIWPVVIDNNCVDANAAVCLILHVGFWNAYGGSIPPHPSNPSILDMTGGTLTTGTDVRIASGTGDTGVFNVSGGIATIGGLFAVGGYDGSGGGDGTLNMSGGTINVTGNLEIGNRPGYGTAAISGGTITAASLLMTARGSLTITAAGMIVLTGDQTTVVNGYKASGWINADAQVQYVTEGEYAGKTVITAAPDPKAHFPVPASGTTNVSPDIVLGWTAGVGAVSHDVYLGTVLSDVNNANRLLADLDGDGTVDWNDIAILSEYWLADPTGSEPYAGIDDDDIANFFDYALLSQDWMNSAGPIFKGNQLATTYDPLGLLDLITTYYWRIDEVNGPDTVRGDIWSFTTQTGKAFNPNPASGASNVALDANLSWSAGFGATSHDVYFGTTYPPEARDNQSGTTFDPGALAMTTTYYWRIDEKTDSNTTITGDDWNFTSRGSAVMRKGPYLLYRGTNTQMFVLWQMDGIDTGCSVVWGTDANYATGSVAATEYGTDYQYIGILSGLTPGTKYYYRLTTGVGQYTGSFLAAPPADAANLKFFMYGDTRTNPSWHDSVCARMIATYTADPAYQTIALHSGDWVERGTESHQTSQWWTYSYTNLMDNVKSIAYEGCIGNHEDDGSVWAKYWPFPFVASPRYYYSFDYGPVHVTVLDQFTTYTNPSAQYTWLVTDLSASTKPWKILVFHQPGWSAGSYHANNTTVQSTIQPLCTQYGVQICLSGDNHYYSRADVNGVQHLTSGAGGAPLYTPEPNQPNIVAYSYGLSFQKVEITDVNTLTCDTIKVSDGTVIDTFTLNR